MGARVKLRLLGPFEARLGSGPAIAFSTRRSQALLAYLALRPDRAHSRASLAALLWSEAPEAAARRESQAGAESPKAGRRRIICA
jgi:DNA-binding SARP family transcriptional activator